MRTLATFQSTAFNTTRPRAYFINPGCYGDDACRWLMSRLQTAGLTTDPEPGQEDFGWYFNFAVPEGKHCCILGLRPASAGDTDTWITWVERRSSFVASLLGGRNRGVSSTAVSAIHQALSAPDIIALRWHERAEFDRGLEIGSSQP